MTTELIKRLRIFGSEPDTGNTYHEAADALEAMQRELELYRAENSGLREAGFENGQDLLTSYFGVKAKLDAAKAEIAGIERVKEKFEPFGWWHQGETMAESDYHLQDSRAGEGCHTCIQLFRARSDLAAINALEK